MGLPCATGPSELSGSLSLTGGRAPPGSTPQLHPATLGWGKTLRYEGKGVPQGAALQAQALPQLAVMKDHSPGGGAGLSVVTPPVTSSLVLSAGRRQATEPPPPS